MSDASVRAGTDSIEQLAESLHEALIRARPVPPLTERNPALGVADAYAIQQINLGRALAAGATLVGRKIGLTSEPMQKLLGVDEPDFGYILDSMLVPDCGTIVRSRMCAPRVEPEIAFRLSRPLSGPGVTIDDVLDATEYVAAALEIVDSRIADWRITLPDTVADNASSGMVVLGSWVDIKDVASLGTVAASFAVNGVTIDSGLGSAVLGHPAAAVAWLVNALAPFGTGIEAGQFVMSGSITGASFVDTGDTASAQLAGLGTVSVHFA